MFIIFLLFFLILSFIYFIFFYSHLCSIGGWEGRQKIIEVKRLLKTNMYFGKKIIIREAHVERYIISKVIAEKGRKKEKKKEGK